MSESSDFLETLRKDDTFMSHVRRWHTVPERMGIYADFPPELDTRIATGLKKRGVSRLYTHQATAFTQTRAGHPILIVTPTASGKTLCYNLPVMQAILEHKEARALYLFPTKALSQDQQSELNELTLGAELGIKIATYDGDTPASLRTSARETGQIVISNPDMLHSGVLPNHPKWIKFLKNLRFVVIDELHSYRGIFGSHVANVIRRLQRIAAFYGSYPVFICCSATIGNPLEHVRALIGQDVHLIDQNGAPSGRKHFILYNPPLVDRVQGIRRGTVNESQALAVKALQAGVKTIVFAKSRVRVELIATYIRERLRSFYTDNHGITVESYRGGYLPQERRAIEKGLRDGSIQAVVSTNALELGIDIGGLDLSIMAGFPGSMNSVWQQAGRAGRRSTESAAILVASSSPLDQYLVQNEDYFLGRSSEQVYVNPNNPHILLEQLKCAAFELPFAAVGNPVGTGGVETDDSFFPQAGPWLQTLEEDGVLRRTAGRWYWAAQSYPSEAISLRSATSENIVIIDTTRGRNEVIGEMDRPSAKELIFPQAVYLHRGQQFLVIDLDLAHRRCYVEERELNFYTDAVVKTDLQVLHEDAQVSGSGLTMVLGDVLVRTQVAKFKKLKFHTHENIGYGEIALPEEEMHTRFIALVFSEATGNRQLSPARKVWDELASEAQGPVLAALGSVIKAVAPAFILCQGQDFGVAERLRDPHFSDPVLYLYDHHPGGSGLSEALAERLSEILPACLLLVTNCSCDEGCPSCIGPRNPEEEIGVNPKQALRDFMQAWLAAIAR